MLFIDSDNALGVPGCNYDDAFAIMALVRSGVEIAGISACGGNVDETSAFENNRRLCAALGWRGPLLHASEARPLLHAFPDRVLALGSLTTVCHATAASEIIIVGGRLHSLGRWPPLWPHERNLTHDRAATHRVFSSKVPLTIFPLDVAGALRVRRRKSLPPELRSQRRPLYDLAAALYAIDDGGFTFEETTAAMKANTFLRFGRGTRAVKVCVKIDASGLWSRFDALLSL